MMTAGWTPMDYRRQDIKRHLLEANLRLVVLPPTLRAAAFPDLIQEGNPGPHPGC